MNSIGDRLEYHIKKKNLNPNKLSKLTGIHATTIKNYIKNIGTPDSLKLDKVAEALDINIEWLISGEGVVERILDIPISGLSNIEINKAPDGKFKKKKGEGLVPYYEVDFAAGNEMVLVDNDKVTPDYYMDIPEFSGCTAFRAYSDSMEKLIKSGSILFGTKVDEWQLHLEYGQIYGIICTDGRRYLKYIRREKTNPIDYFLFQSENEMYDDFEMPKIAIRSIWLIHGWLNKRT